MVMGRCKGMFIVVTSLNKCDSPQGGVKDIRKVF